MVLQKVVNCRFSNLLNLFSCKQEILIFNTSNQYLKNSILKPSKIHSKIFTDRVLTKRLWASSYFSKIFPCLSKTRLLSEGLLFQQNLATCTLPPKITAIIKTVGACQLMCILSQMWMRYYVIILPITLVQVHNKMKPA